MPEVKSEKCLGKYMRMSFWLIDKFVINPIESGNWVYFKNVK